MERTASTFLRWSGRFLLLLAIFVLVCSLFLPSAVQPLNPLVCPDGLELSNARYTLPGAPDNGKLQLVCTGPEYTQDAAREVLLTVAALATLGLVALFFSERLRRPRVALPSGPGLR
ncbi:MAG: hypothetical protein U0P45_03680 [Acidimicrobiales bacterium]